MNKAYGYIVACGYMGYVEAYHEWRLFATESDYLEFIREL